MAGGSIRKRPDGVWETPPGYEALWNVFGLSYASWLVLPRSLMHEMPDDWQAKMAELVQEYFAVYRNAPKLDYYVQVKKGGKFTPLPEWVSYRHPDIDAIESFKTNPGE